MAKRGKILSGMRPTGRMHLGNYVGALLNWVSLQDEYDSHFMVADWHALTTAFDRTDRLRSDIEDMVADWLAAGLDPQRSTIFVQSHVPEHCELMWLLNVLTPVGQLERMTQYKEKSRRARAGVMAGLLNYPVLQAADVLLYKAALVPVGEDQVQHV
ncbi:MAG: tryptophan--tRNA ligase, partial [Armatimonadetes bacterium]|nr:tryptophan--tRNA ligase [Armatimonadota bacterium]